MRAKVYRYYDAHNVLLYVGASSYITARLGAHNSKKNKWFDAVTHITIESFSSADAAFFAEKIAIKNEKPKYNVVNNQENLPDRGFIGAYEIGAMLRIPPGRVLAELHYKRFPIAPYQRKPYKWNKEDIELAMSNSEIAAKIGLLQDA